MAVLVDTSVWRGYLSGRIGVGAARAFSELLDSDEAVLVHPAVLGELVLGGLSSREAQLLGQLPAAPEVASNAVLEFVRARKLPRKGLGWVDAQLLASALVASAALWSLDKQLVEMARTLHAAFDVPVE
jgi:predicted nucleic acid-binding protein